MGLLMWIFFGVVIGVIANAIDPFPSRVGMVGAVILGVLGAVLGGLLGNLIFGIDISRFNFPSFGVAALGSLVLLFISRTTNPRY